MEIRGTQDSQNNREKKKELGSSQFPFQYLLQGYSNQDSTVPVQGQTDLWNRAEDPEINSCICSQLTCDKVYTTSQQGK